MPLWITVGIQIFHGFDELASIQHPSPVCWRIVSSSRTVMEQSVYCLIMKCLIFVPISVN